MAATSAVKFSVRTLTTIALPGGAPSSWAVASDITALTPPMPSVPNATTRSRFVTAPLRDDGSAKRNLVQLAHRVGHRDAAVGHALPQGARLTGRLRGERAELRRVDADDRGVSTR